MWRLACFWVHAGRFARVRLRFRRGLADGLASPCAIAFVRRWIKGAVNERAPEDCGALRYYKRSLVKQMRREGKGWRVLKRLGGEIEVSNPRKRVKLAPAAASLVTFSFALLLSSSLLYAALFPGFSVPSSYASFYAEKSNAASPEGIIRALVGGGSSEVSSVDGNELSSDVSASSALTFSSFFASAIQSTEATVSKTESVKTQNASSDNLSSGGASGDSGQSGPSGGSPAGSEDPDGAASGSGGGATASGLTAAEENEFHAFLVDRFNQCVQLSGSLRESSGHLQYDADLGDFGDAAQWYSDMLIYDNSIDSMKVELNRARRRAFSLSQFLERDSVHGERFGHHVGRARESVGNCKAVGLGERCGHLCDLCELPRA